MTAYEFLSVTRSPEVPLRDAKSVGLNGAAGFMNERLELGATKRAMNVRNWVLPAGTVGDRSEPSSTEKSGKADS
jgi:hypothetical protein